MRQTELAPADIGSQVVDASAPFLCAIGLVAPPPAFRGSAPERHLIGVSDLENVSQEHIIKTGRGRGRPEGRGRLDAYSPQVEANMIDVMGEAAEKLYVALADAGFDVLRRLEHIPLRFTCSLRERKSLRIPAR